MKKPVVAISVVVVVVVIAIGFLLKPVNAQTINLNSIATKAELQNTLAKINLDMQTLKASFVTKIDLQN
jgi:predicted PurR-regulated permease PerM